MHLQVHKPLLAKNAAARLLAYFHLKFRFICRYGIFHPSTASRFAWAWAARWESMSERQQYKPERRGDRQGFL